MISSHVVLFIKKAPWKHLVNEQLTTLGFSHYFYRGGKHTGNGGDINMWDSTSDKFFTKIQVNYNHTNMSLVIYIISYYKIVEYNIK